LAFAGKFFNDGRDPLMIAAPSSLSFDARFNGARAGGAAGPAVLIPRGSGGRGKSPLVCIRCTIAGMEALTSASRSEADDGRTNPAGTDKASAITALMIWATRKVAHMTKANMMPRRIFIVFETDLGSLVPFRKTF
jgi:hypothetical protein